MKKGKEDCICRHWLHYLLTTELNTECLGHLKGDTHLWENAFSLFMDRETHWIHYVIGFPELNARVKVE